jgi:hypothetical protein
MAKSKVLCAHCDNKISSKDAFCPKCSQPTVFATVEQRTEWELAQWSQKRTTARKKVVAHTEAPAKKRAAIDEPPMSEVASMSPPRMRAPIKRVQTPTTIHPAVAARAARLAATAAAEPVRPKRVAPTTEKRVIVLPDVATATDGAPTAMKKPARALKRETPIEAAPRIKAPAPKKEAAPEKPAASLAKARTKAAPKKAPKMAPMTLPKPATKSNGHETNGHTSNGHETNGHETNGHAVNGNGVAKDTAAEQIEILRELLHRVAAIEEKMQVMTAPRARRFRLRKR